MFYMLLFTFFYLNKEILIYHFILLIISPFTFLSPFIKRSRGLSKRTRLGVIRDQTQGSEKKYKKCFQDLIYSYQNLFLSHSAYNGNWMYHKYIYLFIIYVISVIGIVKQNKYDFIYSKIYNVYKISKIYNFSLFLFFSLLDLKLL